MKIAVSATAPHLDADLDPRFGRCLYLLIIDTETMGFEAVENPAMSAPGGAGIRAAQTVAETGVTAVVTGNCGPNAYEALSAAGIEVAVGASGSVRQAVEAYQQGRLQSMGGPSASPGYGAGDAWPPAVGGRGGSSGPGGRGAGRGGLSGGRGSWGGGGPGGGPGSGRGGGRRGGSRGGGFR
jgi:predicted Fe-Mo cluster-binding NifX family protein